MTAHYLGPGNLAGPKCLIRQIGFAFWPFVIGGGQRASAPSSPRNDFVTFHAFALNNLGPSNRSIPSPLPANVHKH